MLTRFRKGVLLVASVLLILILAVVAAWGQLGTAGRVGEAQRADRMILQTGLSGLTAKALEFTLLDTQRAADAVSWTLTPQDSRDEQALRQATQTSPLTGYGAMLTTLAGKPLTSYARGALPAPTDRGFGPMAASLAAGEGGVSDVMHVGPNVITAFAVPVRRSGKPVALLIAFADMRTWPTQGYTATLSIGEAAVPYFVDGKGTISAAGADSEFAVGDRLSYLPAPAISGRSGLVTVTHAGRRLVVSYVPASHGWAGVSVQDESSFTAGTKERNKRDALVLIVLLTLIVLLLVWFHHQRQQALRRLAEDRLYDPLTGLAQRRLFHIRMQAALARHRRTGAPLAVLYCDLDDFKAVNDVYGHNVGDQLLVEVATRMREATREDDFVVRMGGDEFAVVLEATAAEQVAIVVARLRDRCQQPLTISGNELSPRISIGGAVLHDSSRADELLAAADAAMYDAKRAGTEGNVVVLAALVPTALNPIS